MFMQPPSVNRILANNVNAVRSAEIAASAQRASTDIRLIAQNRQGGGRLEVSGSYTGAADTVIDVEILGGEAGALRASEPIVNGVGSGTLEVLSVNQSALPETLAFSLLHAGDPATPALLEFFGTTLAARAPGASGNAISVSVRRNLSFADLPYATLETISAGTSQFEGPQWDWGQPSATDSGIPKAALRIAFKGFPTVHRAWKTWEDGRFVYRLDPPTVYEIPADVRIQSVSGDYTICGTFEHYIV